MFLFLNIFENKKAIETIYFISQKQKQIKELNMK